MHGKVLGLNLLEHIPVLLGATISEHRLLFQTLQRFKLLRMHYGPARQPAQLLAHQLGMLELDVEVRRATRQQWNFQTKVPAHVQLVLVFDH